MDWTELGTGSTIDIYRRNLQKVYTDILTGLINTGAPSGLPEIFRGLAPASFSIKNTDIPSIARAQLTELKNEIAAAIPRETDKLSKFHLQDLFEQIRLALNPKP